MRLADLSNGADWVVWVVWVVFAIVALVSVVLISGHGSGLISGYNVASKKKKPSIMKNAYVEQWAWEWL